MLTQTNERFSGDVVDVSQHFQTDFVFESRDALLSYCRDIGKQIGVVIVIRKSESPTSRRRGRLILGCEHGGNYKRNDKCTPTGSKESRNTDTTKKGCPFNLKGLPQNDGKWKLQVLCGEHNHQLAEKLIGHPYVGRLTTEEMDYVRDLWKTNTRPRDILINLKEKFPDNISTRKTIYNALLKLRNEEKQGLPTMQFLMKVIEDHGYHSFTKVNLSSNRLTNIFWTHHESIKLFMCFPNVLIVDCTYKTNRYKMPLFELVGVTSTNQTFNIGFVFMEKEK